MRIHLLIILLYTSLVSNAQKVVGIITDTANQPLSFSSIIVKGTTLGTSANSKGMYSLQLKAGSYTLVCQHVGYKSDEKSITISNEDQQLNFTLKEQQYDVGSVTVKSGVNPANEIIRNAIRKRPVYEKELKKFTTEVYIKGQLQLRDHPKRFLGQKVDFEDGDTSKRKMIFLSETVATYSVDEPKRKVEVTSTRVSGQSDAFGFSSPQIISFYQKNIRFGNNLNPRGFISPVTDNAFNYYNYKFEGTFFDNGKMINRIKVIPKRSYEPLFNGYINIMENEWRIYSVQLTLYKENQMQLVDTLIIEQQYVPLANVWVIKQQTIYPSIKMMGFNVHGSFVQVYDKFDVDPAFGKQFFNNTVLRFYDSANKRSPAYWDTIRPVPLLVEEANDYKKKDSLEQLRKDPHYLDSLDKKRNKINPISMITLGQTFTSEKNKTSLTIDPLIEIVSYNTVEGTVINFKPSWQKRFSDTKRNAITIIPGVRYGFSNERFNGNLTVGYRYGRKYLSSIIVSGGRDVYQYNRANPVNVFGNAMRTLRTELNYLKIYEAGYASINYLKTVGKGFTISSSFEYQDRISLENTSFEKWRDVVDREFTPNITQPHHLASVLSLGLRWQPGSRYIEFPERVITIGSKFPTLNLTLTKGIKELFGSDVDFTKWNAAINDDLNLKLAGRFSYRITAGGFLNRNVVFFPDYTHYLGNQVVSAQRYLQSFQLLPYYSHSNVEKFYSTAHIEYHLNGFLTNKIPGFKKLNWFLVSGANFLYLPAARNYSEAFIGLENIFKIGRVDYVRALTNNIQTSGIRFSVRGITGGY